MTYIPEFVIRLDIQSIFRRVDFFRKPPESHIPQPITINLLKRLDLAHFIRYGSSYLAEICSSSVRAPRMKGRNSSEKVPSCWKGLPPEISKQDWTFLLTYQLADISRNPAPIVKNISPKYLDRNNIFTLVDKLLPSVC